jgi:hypothetical protein
VVRYVPSYGAFCTHIQRYSSGYHLCVLYRRIRPSAGTDTDALGCERRGQEQKGIAAYLYWFPVMVNLLIIVIRYAEYSYIMQRTVSFSGLWAFVIPVIGIPLLIIIIARGIRQLINEQ